MTDTFDFLTIENTFRVLIFVFLFGYCLFSLVLMFRIKILADTLQTKKSGFVSLVANLHFFLVLAGSILVGILILF